MTTNRPDSSATVLKTVPRSASVTIMVAALTDALDSSVTLPRTLAVNDAQTLMWWQAWLLPPRQAGIVYIDLSIYTPEEI